MKPFVVAEGETDRAVLRAALRFEPAGSCEIVAARGKESAIKLAASIMMNRSAPVAVLVDADTTDPARIERQREEYARILTAYRNDTRFRLFFAVPDIESLVLSRPHELAAALRGLSGAPVLPDGDTPEARKRAVADLVAQGRDIALQQALARYLLADPTLAGLTAFVREQSDAVLPA